MTQAAIVAFAGGIGLFLLGMRLMTTGLQSAAGPELRRLLARGTTTQPRAVGAGLAITALVQSSSAVTFATIGFVNAGLIGLPAAIAVIYGANVGTTVTSWLVALVGFKLDLQALALPAIAVGMALRVTAGTARRGFFGEALAGFGVFFLGIDVLKDAFDGLGTLVEPGQAASQLLLPYVGIGFLMTLVMQSSSAALVVTLSAAGTGVLPLQAAAAMVVGANVGTTTTAVFAVIGATAAAKRAATAHVAFNIVAAIVALLTLPALLWAIGLAGNALLGRPLAVATALAAFHTLANVLGLLVMWPLTAPLNRWLEGRFVATEGDVFRPRFLDRNIVATSPLALEAVAKELEHALELARSLALRSLTPESARPRHLAADCASLDRLVRSTGDFATAINDPQRTEDVALTLRVNQYLADVSERVLEYAHRGEAAGAIGQAEAAAAFSWLETSAREALEQASHDVFESHYQEVKATLLHLGAGRRMPLPEMVSALDQISALRRLVDQFAKAARGVAALSRSESDSQP